MDTPQKMIGNLILSFGVIHTARRASLDLPGVAYCHGTSIGIADVKVANGRAYIFYFMHSGRIYRGNKNEDPDKGRWRYRRSSLHVAEL